jgi:beta-mannosidase
MEQSLEIGASPNAEISGIEAAVPGSVQMSLLTAGLLPDWTVGLNYRACEWVENRHWVYEAALPDEWMEQNMTTRLNCQGLDYCGTVMVNDKIAGDFVGSFIPHIFDLTDHLRQSGNTIRIIFDLSPRWLGQFGFTSKMREWKPRFNYTWDWVPRLVQAGICEPVFLEVTDREEILSFRCTTDADVASSTGVIKAWGRVCGRVVRVSLSKNGRIIRDEKIDAAEFNSSGIEWNDLPVDLWWPNLSGDQPLYDLRFALLDENGTEIDAQSRRVGFKNVTWQRCEGAEHADPWICAVNGQPIFLQGINWVPIRPNYADLTEADYRKRLLLYKTLGLNILRVWGGAFLEREIFYNLCDELGLMVWQEFPLSSSGIDNHPPSDEKSIEAMAGIVESYIARRQHHVSLIIWCGGNELQTDMDGAPGQGRPADETHPMLARMQNIAQREDPTRRFLTTSSSGPTFTAAEQSFGKGIHWDVHGPWKADGDLDGDWARYWANDDALFRSEAGAPGASPVEIIRKSAGDLEAMPADAANALWRRTSPWWIERHEAIRELGRAPDSIEEYVDWSQARQTKALSIAVKACKDRFPRCGGIILWMGHDCYPCTANTSIVDVDGNPKPAAIVLKEIWRRQ